jgi:V8-like Glu-specific endopeptidase
MKATKSTSKFHQKHLPLNLIMLLYVVVFCFLRSTSLAQLSNGRVEIGNTQASSASKATGKIVSLWPNGNTTHGSGVLVSPRHVLTAAHNIYWPAFGGHAKLVIFGPAEHGSISPFGVSFCTSMVTHKKWRTNASCGGNYDIGMIRLRHPLGTKAGWMDLTPWSSDPNFPVNLNGYDADIFNGRHQITRTGRASSIKDWPWINSRYSSRWFAPPGVSGGPVWYMQSGRPKVIGVATSKSNLGNSNGTKNLPEFDDMFKAWMRTYP